MPDAIGIPEEMLRKASSMAVCKINIDSDLRLAMTAGIRRHFAENPGHFDPVNTSEREEKKSRRSLLISL